MSMSIEYETAHEIHGWVKEVRRFINEQRAREKRRITPMTDEIDRAYSFGKQSGLYLAWEEVNELLIRIEEIFLREDEQGESLEDEENREYWKNVLNDELRRNR